MSLDGTPLVVERLLDKEDRPKAANRNKSLRSRLSFQTRKIASFSFLQHNINKIKPAISILTATNQPDVNPRCCSRNCPLVPEIPHNKAPTTVNSTPDL